MNFFFRHLMKKYLLVQQNKRNKQVRVVQKFERTFLSWVVGWSQRWPLKGSPAMFVFLAWLKSLSWDYNFTVVLFLLRYWRQITVSFTHIYVCTIFYEQNICDKKVNVRIEPVSARSRTGIWRSIVDNFLWPQWQLFKLLCKVIKMHK